jgi:hypothetical protein
MSDYPHSITAFQQEFSTEEACEKNSFDPAGLAEVVNWVYSGFEGISL